MSFQNASPIIGGRWLLNKQWVAENPHIMFALAKGDVAAFKALTGDEGDDEDSEPTGPQLLDAGKRVYEVRCYTDLSSLPANTIAYVDINGPLFKTGYYWYPGMQSYAALFYALMMCDNVDGVILDLDSPGGQADGTQTFAEAIAACQAVKPVIGLVDDGISGSAAYWSICASTEVYVSKRTDMVGSIGVYCTVYDIYKYFESIGLPVKDVYAPGSEDKNADFRESIAGNDDLLKAELKVLRDVFVDQVKTYRKGKIKGTDWATGKMYFPEEAQSLGLIDGIKSFDQVVWRITRLISQRKSQITNSNTMAFEKVLTVAGAQEFEVTDNGFVLSEANLHAVNTALTLAEQNAAALATANTARATAEAALATANTEHAAALAAAKTVSDAAAATAATALNTANETISSLNAKITEMGNLDAGRPSSPQGASDKNDVSTDAKNFETKFDREAAAISAQQKLANQ